MAGVLPPEEPPDEPPEEPPDEPPEVAPELVQPIPVVSAPPASDELTPAGFAVTMIATVGAPDASPEINPAHVDPIEFDGAPASASAVTPLSEPLIAVAIAPARSPELIPAAATVAACTLVVAPEASADRPPDKAEPIEPDHARRGSQG